MKKVIITITIICCVIIAGAALVLTGVIRTDFLFGEKETYIDKRSVAYVYYGNQYAVISADGLVMSMGATRPEGIPEIAGIEFTQMGLGNGAVTAYADLLEYAVKIAKEMHTYGMPELNLITISLETGEASLSGGKATILLGKDEGTAEKINDLSNFYREVIVMDGTLDMQHVSTANLGYTFKKTAGTETVTDKTENGEETPEEITEEPEEENPDEDIEEPEEADENIDDEIDEDYDQEEENPDDEGGEEMRENAEDGDE